MASTRKLVVQVLGDARGLMRAYEQAARSSMSFGEKVAATSKKMAIPAAAAFGALSAAGLSFAKAAAEDAQASALLARQLQNSTGATQAQTLAVEDYITKLSIASGIADDKLRPALAALSRATGDVARSQQLLGVALDISAGTGRSLSSVVQALSRASQGQFTALRRLGVPLSDNIVKSKDFDAALQALSATFRGQADVAANSTAGRFRRFGVAVDEAKESIGAALLPALEAVLPRLVSVAQWAEKNGPLIAGIGAAIGAVSAAFLAGVTALKVWQTAAKITTAINTALAASGFAVQISTGVGIATAIAGAAALGTITYMLTKATKAQTDYAASIDTTREATRKLLEYDVAKGLLPASSLARFDANTKAMKDGLSGVGSAADSAAQRFKTFADRVKSVKDQVRAFVASVAQQIGSTVSLADAFASAQNEQEEAANRLTEALQRRKDAYDALNQAQQTGDALRYAQALQEISAAEAAVGEAQAIRPRDYTAIFRSQIEAAKTFSANLRALAQGGNLSQAALQQLLDLGPVAGAQVAQDLLNGVGGFTAASLSADIASVEAAGRGVGLAMPGVSELLGARTGQRGDSYFITVNAGVGDKAAIAKEIVELLKIYNRSNGAIPVKVK